MNPTDVDYSAFDKGSRVPKLGIYIGLSGLVLVLAGLILTTMSGWSGSRLISGLLFSLSVPVAFGGITLFMKQKQAVNLLALAQFVADNNWQFTKENTTTHIPTSLLGVGRDQQIPQSFGGTFGGLPMNVTLFEYTTGNGKSEATHQFASVCFDLPEQFPLIVLDNKGTRFWDMENGTLPERIPGGKSLQVEGDFNKSYNITVIPGTEQEVLEFLTPDFMSELLSKPNQTDVELEADRLFVIEHNLDMNQAILSRTGLQSLFETSTIVIKHLQELAPTWQASSSSDTINQMATRALAPRNQIMLQPKHVAGIGGLIAIGIYLAFWLISVSH